MTTNMNGIDRFVRIIVGLGLCSLIFVLHSNARWWGLIGLIPLLTSLLGYCPLYRLVGIGKSSVSQAK